MTDIPTYRRRHSIVPIMSREEVVAVFCECLGLEDVQPWPDGDAISCHDPMTGSNFCAELGMSLNETVDKLAEHRWRFQ
jgi:hypothetical protein